MTANQPVNWKLKFTLSEYIIELLKDKQMTIDQLHNETLEDRHAIRGRLSDLRRRNQVIKLSNNKFDLTNAYRKGLD